MKRIVPVALMNFETGKATLSFVMVWSFGGIEFIVKFDTDEECQSN